MRLFGISALLVIVLNASSFAQSEARGPKERICNLPVKDLQIEARNINLLMSKLAYQYNVAISLEVAIDDDLLSSKHIKLNVKKGTLADVLDDIVEQQPSYTWESSESTIRVFPKQEKRDPFLQALLETKISHFVIPRSTARLTIKQTLTNRPELKDLLASNGVRLSKEVFLSHEIQSIGPDFSLDLENVLVRGILDYMMQNSQTRYWSVRRSGDSLWINF